VGACSRFRGLGIASANGVDYGVMLGVYGLRTIVDSISSTTQQCQCIFQLPQCLQQVLVMRSRVDGPTKFGNRGNAAK
jgi:hypothetical protein